MGVESSRFSSVSNPHWYNRGVDAEHCTTFINQRRTSISIRTTAKSIGNKDASTSELAATIRKAYAKAKPEAQQEIRTDFHIGYIAGKDRVSISEAAAIWEAGKGAGAINAPAIARAVAAWKYYVADHLKQATPAPEPKSFRISREHHDLAMDFLANFEGKNLAEQIKQAVALLNALK